MDAVNFTNFETECKVGAGKNSVDCGDGFLYLPTQGDPTQGR